MANVVYRGKSITFPDGMSEAEIAQAMPSIADQIDTDFLNESSAQKTPEKKESFSDKAVSLAKDAAGYIKNNALKLPVAIAKELKSNSVVDGMDGVSVKANQESESTLKKVLDKNKKPNNLQEGSEVVDGISGVAKVGLNRGYAGLGKIEAGLVKSLADLTGSEKLANIAESQNKYANEIENRAVLRGSPVEGFAKESIVQDLPEAGSNAISSVIQTAPALAIGAASGGSALPALFGGVGLQEYNEGREKDLSPFQSATRAVPMAVAEVVGEKLGGFDKIAKGLRQATKGNGVADLGAAMLESSLKELPSEELTTTLQFLVDKTPGIGLNQDATFDDYKKAVKDTALATILQSGGMGAGGAVLTNIANKLDAPAGTQEAAEIDQQLLNAFNASQQIKQDQLQQAEADTALANITSPDTTIDDAIALAEKATDVPTAKPSGLLSAVSEAIPASDILGDENVSDTTNATTELANETITGSSDNIQGSLGDLPNQLAGRSDTGPIDNSTEASAQGSGSDQLNGNGIQGNDAIAILNGEDAVSRPFAQATDDFLPKMRSMTTDAKVISQIDEELKLRGITNVDSVNTPTERVDETAKDVHVGEKINKEWTAFSPESGTLNIPRSEMPQVKAEHRGAMVNFLNARGVDHTQETVPASSLKPTQQEFSEAKVKKASEYAGGDRSILVSADNHVLDGHHQWLSKLNKGGDVDVIRLNAPIAQLLNDVKEFPSSTVEDGATTSKVQKPKSTKQYKPKTLLATLRDIGDIKLSEKQDVTGEVKGFAPGGYNQVFKQASNRSLKGLIESGDLDDYLPYNMRLESNGANDDAFDSTEAYDYLADKIRNGESVLPYAVVEEAQANQYYQDAGATAESDVQEAAELLTEDEINEQLRQATNEERETATEARVINTERENGDTGSGERSAATTQTNASQQAEVTDSNTDLLGDNTTAKQAVADAERAKDAKRNSGNDNQDTFTLNGSNSEADQAAAAGAQGLFSAPIKQQSNTEASTGADVAENTANQSSNGQANEEASEIDYNGVRLYKIKVRNRVEGQPPTEMWAVESTENKERKARGERAIGGDNLSETLDEAKAEAELMLKREADNNQAADAQAKLEAEQKEKSRIDADKKSDIDGFGSELNAMQLGKLKETLNKPTSINGVVSPLRDAVRNLVSKGGKPEIKEENVYKGMSRAQYNRADNRAQQEDEKRIREGGKKNVYYITMPDGGMFELGKTAHDFAEHLITNKNSDVNETNFVNTQPESKPQDEVTKAAEALTAAGVKGKEKLDTIKDVREGKVTADEVADAYGAQNQATEEDGADQAPVGRIDDFGEKLEGAKKDLWKNYQKAMGDELPADAKDITLSKHFPEPDYDNLIASGMDIKAIAAIKAMRDEIPSKPKMPSKVRRWGAELGLLRDLSNKLINQEYGIDKLLADMRANQNLSKFVDRIELYAELGFPAMKSAKGYNVTGGWTSFDKGVAEAGKKTALEYPNGKREYFNDRQTAVDALRTKLEVAPEGTERKTKLDVYRVTATGDLVIGKKVASNKYIDLKGGFKSPKEAFQYYSDNEAELLQLLEQRKNVRPERRSTNNPRVGIDYRLGQDVTPEKFAAEFGFRGVQFGNYVEQSRRPRDLNNAYDALLDLANIIGVPPRAISLNGTLGLAFGARGKGGKNPAAAHFERGEVVINLTKVNGFGSLGHEWFHAMDNYFSKARGDNEYLTQKPQQKRTYKAGEGFELDESIRPEVLSAFKNLMDAIRKSEYYTRSSKIDNTRTNDYWSTAEELAARAFEAYLIAKSKDSGRSNDYLANIEDEDVYEIANQAAKDFGAFEDPYPYPTRAEQTEINPLFDALFGELKTKETDSGNVVMFSRSSKVEKIDGKTKVTEYGNVFETGKPVTFNYAHNTFSATKLYGKPNKNSEFFRGYEPSGEYVISIDEIPATRKAGYEYGTITFNNPLVIDNDSLNWKKSLSDYFGGLTGKKLSIAVINAGYDGIVTTDGNYTSEIINLQTFDEAKALYSRSNQPTFYSALTRAIEEIKTNKADPKLWKGMIKNLAQKGVKPDEVEWTGVNEWLDLQTSAVTKEQLLDYLNANGVQVSETVLNDNANSTYDFRLSEDGDAFDIYMDGEVIEAVDNANDALSRITELRKDPTKYSKYTVEGGTNYKELLLTLPIKESMLPKGYEVFEKSAGNWAVKMPDGLVLGGWADREGAIRSQMSQDESKAYTSGHFTQKNILAHVRFDERTDADGNKVLFINEIQSDYGQDGKKRGFKLTDAEISSMKGYSLAVKIEELNRDWRGDRTSKAEQDKGWAEVEAEKQSKGITDADIKAAKEAIDRNVVALPRAPFVTKTDAWVSLAMKRMVRYAAENGFDKVAFISGEQAADLYDLSKQINMASAIANNDGTYNLILEDKSGNEISGYDRSGKKLNPQELEDTIGKYLAAKLIDGADRNKGKPWPKSASSNPAFFTLRGLDLKVGGDGMRTFYNSIVPKVAKDVLKKVGGQVDSINMQTVSDEEFEAALDKAADNGEMIAVGSDAYNALRYKQQVGFTITPEMREKVMGGLPLFNREANLAKGLPKEAIQRAVNVLRRNWKNAPEIIVVQDMSDPAIREAVREENDRQLSQGAEGQPEGFFDAGKVYIVASEMNTPDDLIRVVFHETLGHYGLRGLYGKELGGILDRVAMLRRRDMAKKAKQYGLDLTKKSDVRIIAEEVLAEMAQTAPEAGFVKRAIAAIRQFLRDIGVKLELTDNDIIANYLLPARNYVTQGAQQRGLVGNLSTAFNRDNSPTTAQLFKELTLNDDMFKYPKSNAVDMKEVFNEVAPGLLHIEKSKSFDDEVSELYSVYPIDASGNPIRSKVGFINVYDDGKVEINVSSLGEGFGGSRIYAAVGNWAYNNGKVFAGDREGISPAGISRRLENMISLALKFGTTDHIMPHKDQMNDLGFDWKEGDTEYNLAEMLKASFNAIRNGVYVKTENFGIELTEKSNDAKGVSKLDDLVYDFDKHQFTDLSNGKPYTTGDFDKLASTSEARAAYAGRTTLQRAALGNTFMGATREGKQFLLEQLGKLSLQPLQLTDPQLAGIFYSRSTPQTDTPQFKAWFGDSKVVDADGKPLVVYHGTQSDFNAFDKSKDKFNRGFWFSTSSVANRFAMAERGKDGGDNVMPAYLSIKNPYFYDANAIDRPKNLSIIFEEAKAGSYDGVYMKSTNGKSDTYVAFEPSQIKSAIGNNGNFDGNNNDIRFSRTASPQGRLTPQWQVDETSKMDNVIRALQDKYIDLKRITQEIKKAGNDISDRWNAYLQEELYHGRSAKRVQDFIKQDLTPLIEDMRMRGVGMADFEEYLWMRHAPERNEQIAKINPDMPDGGAGVTTAEAESYMDGLNPADKKKYEALAKRIDAITAKSRQVLVDYGLESQSTVNAWQSAYEFYVPLMREDMERGTGNGTGSGFKVKGNSSKRAMGSNRAVVDVIANIAQQYEKNIVRGEKNRVATAMIGLAKLNPNEEFWNVETPPTIRHVSKATGLVETRTDPSYKNRNNVIVARIVNKRGEIEERSVTFNEFNDRAMKMALSLNNLDVDQVSAVSNFMGNITRYFSSINTQYNPIFGIVNITRDTQGAMLNLSTTELAGKQKEVLANIMPALRGIYAETRTDNGIKSPMQFGSFTAAQKSKAQAMRALWEEYQREGGTTGFRDMYANAEERTKAVSKALDPNWWTKTLAGKVVTVGGVLTVPETVLKDKAIKPVFDWLSDYNQTLENAVRLAAYKVAIDSGISKQQAASIGKNLTVNFNRKGAYTRTMGSWYAFFNAAVQGTARIGETLTGPKGKQIIAGGISIGVAQALMLAMAGFDEDEPPEFVRSSNFIIPIPNTDQKYITIPMPLGFNVLPNFGRITTEWALSGAENTTERVFDIFGAVMESFNPLGGNGRIDSIIMPTVADPFNDLSKNEDWTGRNIAQEDFSNLRPTPGYTRTRDKATELSIELARWINNLSGGDDYEKGQLSPTGDQIEYLTGQLTGGVGREVVKTVNTIESIVTGEDLPTYKIPLVGRFVGNSAGQAPQAGKFYNNLIKLNKLEAGYLGRLKDGKDADKFLNENPELNYADYGKKAQSAISKLRDYKRDLVKEGANREEVKLVDEQITLIMTEFNQTIKPETTTP
ncbi:MAG: hypothetical protein CTY14_02190 [Methylotenera sp.]|nr:MAG: hypothetical protein CTY14_02190 [Methylotenera sp.]